MTWMAKHGLVPEGTVADAEYRERAIELREAIYRVMTRLAEGKEAEEADLDILNDELCEAMSRLEVKADLTWNLDQAEPKERALMILAISAASLITSPLRARIRACADPACAWIFIDHSKNRSRRWCTMSDCGNKAKARRFQARKRQVST